MKEYERMLIYIQNIQIHLGLSTFLVFRIWKSLMFRPKEWFIIWESMVKKKQTINRKLNLVVIFWESLWDYLFISTSLWQKSLSFFSLLCHTWLTNANTLRGYSSRNHCGLRVFLSSCIRENAAESCTLKSKNKKHV